MTKKVIIIGKEHCPYCTSAVSLSKARKVNFEYKKVPEDLELSEAYKLAGEAFTTFPFIFVQEGDNKTKIGGFNEYRIAINSIDKS